MTEAEQVEAIRASDLMLLMDVVRDATGLYNAVERGLLDKTGHVAEEFEALGKSLRALGLNEVVP